MVKLSVLVQQPVKVGVKGVLSLVGLPKVGPKEPRNPKKSQWNLKRYSSVGDVVTTGYLYISLSVYVKS